MFSLLFVFESVYFICFCNKPNTAFSLVAHKLPENYMNNQEKFMT